MKKPLKDKLEADLVVDASAKDHDWIAEMAYFLAEKRGFVPGCELDDWRRAEELRAGEA